jgi:hypothetical protein
MQMSLVQEMDFDVKWRCARTCSTRLDTPFISTLLNLPTYNSNKQRPPHQQCLSPESAAQIEESLLRFPKLSAVPT